jgi:hypothetical protein
METSAPPTDVHSSFRKSWVAYIGPVFSLLVLGAIAIATQYFLRDQPFGIWIVIAIVVVAIGLFVFNVMTIRSVLLYTDDHGVWVYSGILPWSKGVAGVKWRDLEDAVYMTNFSSWILRSYKVRVGHRFTKTSEIVLTHIARGNIAVEQINAQHRQALANGRE